jgi:hypothetical protein
MRYIEVYSELCEYKHSELVNAVSTHEKESRDNANFQQADLNSFCRNFKFDAALTLRYSGKELRIGGACAV